MTVLSTEMLTHESFEPISIGLSFFSRSSSIPGSPILSILQPLINGRLLSAAGVLIGAEFLLLLFKYFFNLETIPVYDVPKNRIVQIPIGELEGLLQAIGTKQKNVSQRLPVGMQDTNGLTYEPTIFPPEAPLILSIYIAADFSAEPYAPTIWMFIPVLTFPGMRGSLPMVILGLLETIFNRCVVPPETTGSKPLPKPSQRSNPSLNLHPEDLLGILNRFGKYFNSH